MFFAEARAENEQARATGLLAPADLDELALWLYGADETREQHRHLRLVEAARAHGGEVA